MVVWNRASSKCLGRPETDQTSEEAGSGGFGYYWDWGRVVLKEQELHHELVVSVTAPLCQPALGHHQGGSRETLWRSVWDFIACPKKHSALPFCGGSYSEIGIERQSRSLNPSAEQTYGAAGATRILLQRKTKIVAFGPTEMLDFLSSPEELWVIWRDML